MKYTCETVYFLMSTEIICVLITVLLMNVDVQMWGEMIVKLGAYQTTVNNEFRTNQ